MNTDNFNVQQIIHLEIASAVLTKNIETPTQF